VSEGYSQALRTLLSRSIVSVEQVEVLLLLRGAQEKGWTPEAISTELRSSVNSVRRRLDDLLRSKLVERNESGEFFYSAAAAEPAVGELAHEYQTRRVRLIEAIFARPVDAARSFADAFRLWEDDDDR
jgi:predicted ArsR family transcriptional regulator